MGSSLLYNICIFLIKGVFMSNPKYKTFIQKLENVISLSERDEVKEVIGDSTNNNRTLSVTQVIRYLDQIGEFRLSEQLDNAYTVLYDQLWEDRAARGVTRNDVFDINEFFATYNNFVIAKNTDIRKYVVQAVA